MNRVIRIAVAATLLCFLSKPTSAQVQIGVTSEFFVPIGDLRDISQIGVTAIMYAVHRKRRARVAFEVDGGIQWFIPRTLQEEEVPEWVPNPEPDNQGRVSFSGTFLTARGSITPVFGRYYLSPKVGVYIPTGDYNKELDLNIMFGVAPRIGYMFPIMREMQFDLAAEFNYLFGERAFQYIGFGVGIYFGGGRPQRIAY